VRTIKRLLALAIVVIIGAFFYIWFGVFNVAATEKHSDLTLSLIAFVRDRSIAVRTEAPPSPDLTDPALTERGFKSYHTMCVICHSAPGRKATAIRKGLNPKPPRLYTDRVQRRSDTELYWIIEHGMRMTGMPALGPTHKPNAIWGLVAFMRQLP
jgi:mono/diheme cytochrome c family protein